MMNTTMIKGDWKQLKGKVKSAFAKLTDDDLSSAEGNVDELVGVIQERYGYTRTQARKAWNAFKSQLDEAADTAGDKLDDAGEQMREITAPYRPSRINAKSVAVVATFALAVILGGWFMTSSGRLGDAVSTCVKRGRALLRS